VYPFAKLVAENFARSNTGFKSPIIESTGTGGGINLFCAGIGPDTPDIANASRRMKPDEFQNCLANGVDEVIEIPIGLDGLALASAKDGISLSLTPELVYRALARNPYGQPQTAKPWADVAPSLPAEPIFVYGPPSTSGTRDSFEELILMVGCESNPAMKSLKEADEEKFEQVCTEVRSDGAYVDQGENDNLIVQKLQSNPRSVGVFGYSYLEENLGSLKGLPLNGIEPNYETISSGRYPGAREMFVYAKKAHVDAIPGLREFLASWVSASAEGGPLAGIGLIISPAAVRAQAEAAASTLVTMSAVDLD